ncbi:MAG TPA: helix-turn-helix domain-containing protein [Candidatus Acidoferrum sp.]|nr:helix-turn-helix domain-containing protein [Candidatus Acidoferrum sp.]
MGLSMEVTDEIVKVYDENSEAWKFVKKDKGLKQLTVVEDTLSRFGLLKNEIRVYLYLARSGEKKASEIAEAISLHRTETYRILRDLEKKGIVFSAFEKPLKFTAVPMEKTMELLIEAQKMKIKLLEQEKVGLVELWLSLPQPKVEDSKKEIFQILEGEQQIIIKANDLLKKTKTELKIFAPGDYLAQLYHSDFTDNLELSSKKIHVKLLTDDSLKGKFFLEKMKSSNQDYRKVGVKNLPCFIISDEKELLMIIQKSDERLDDSNRKKPKVVALWTNYAAFVETLQVLFSKLDEP